jgi:hypothetical protein
MEDDPILLKLDKHISHKNIHVYELYYNKWHNRSLHAATHSTVCSH